jgi:hypothetical protein
MKQAKSTCYKQLSALITPLIVASALAACGGRGDDDDDVVTTATGQFKDSNAAGIGYSSGAQNGVTDAQGRFIYEVGETVRFAVGGVTLGTTAGKPVVTPVDLVAGGSTDSSEVQNIVRFLLMLDEDSDPSNGISISSSVQGIAETWEQVDFTDADQSTQLMSIVSDVFSVDGVIRTLPDAVTAKAHMEETLGCIYAGGYTGTFSGDDRGTFGILVHPDGDVEGIAYSKIYDEYTELAAATSISYDQMVTFASDFNAVAGSYEGRFTSVNTLAGTWDYPPDAESGTFAGSRIGGTADARYRFTGRYEGDDHGLFTFDVDGSNKVSGVAYSVAFDELFTFDGSVSGTALSAVSSEGGMISGTLDTDTGELSGTWSGDGTGDFEGSGCSLN